MESSNTVTKESGNSLTVSIFFEICILQRKMGKTWNDVSEHINDVYMVTIKPVKIYNPYQNAPIFQKQTIPKRPHFVPAFNFIVNSFMD